MAAAVVEASLAAVPATRLVSLQGGDKRNAIPRECSALLVVRACDCFGALTAGMSAD